MPLRETRAKTKSAAASDLRRWMLEAMLDEERSLEVISSISSEFSSGRLLSCEVLDAKKKFGRLLVFCRIHYQEEDDRAETAETAIKIYRKDAGSTSLRALHNLRAAGFREPGEFRVPKPYGYSPEHHALMQETVAGTPWAACLQSNEQELAQASRRAAGWLIHLQESGAEAEIERRDAAVEVERMAHEISVILPDQSSPLEDSARRLARRLRARENAVPSHGDYHPENVLLAPVHTNVIDLDHFGLREPSFDVGYAIGQFMIMSYLREGSFTSGARAATAFWRAYESCGGQAKWTRVATHVARTFLQSLHYELCVLKNGNTALAHVWLGSARQFLDNGSPEIIEDPIRYS